MTLDALKTAQAFLPGASSRASMLPWVTTAVTVLPPGRARVTSAFTGPSWMWLISPHSWLRAVMRPLPSVSRSREEAQVLHRFPGDDGHYLGTGVQGDAHFHVHPAIPQAADLANELVAGAGLYREAAQQGLELAHVALADLAHVAGQAIQGPLVFLLHGPVEGDDAAAIVGEPGTAAAAAAGAAHHQGLVGQVVHGIHRIPGSLVGKGHGLGGLGDGAVGVDGLQQADAGIAEKGAELGFQGQLAHQLLLILGHHSLFLVAKYTKLHSHFGACAVIDAPLQGFIALWLNLCNGTT